MKASKQISESIPVMILLTLSGGFMDAYSYLCRGEVFANAQTGNILLFGVNLSMGQWNDALRYACPIVAFALGIAAAELVRRKFTNTRHIHWRQVLVLCEALVLFSVMTIPKELNLLANSLTSMACGVQVEAFRKVKGNGMATTMCIGNLRMATQSVCDYWFTKDKKAMKKGFLFFGIIAVFTVGAVIGNISVRLMSEKAIAISSLLLITAFLIMLVNKED